MLSLPEDLLSQLAEPAGGLNYAADWMPRRVVLQKIWFVAFM